MQSLAEAIAAKGSELVKQVGAVVLFEINGKQWTLDLKNGSGKIEQGQTTATDCTITMKEADFLNLLNGKLSPQTAFLLGKLKLKGNMAAATKLSAVFAAAASQGKGGAAAAPAAPSSIVAVGSAVVTTTVASSAPSPSSSTIASSKGGAEVSERLLSSPIFDAIAVAIQNDGAELVKSVAGIIRFELIAAGGNKAAPPHFFLLDLKNGKGSFLAWKGSSPAAGGAGKQEGKAGGAGAAAAAAELPSDVTITMTDADFLSLAEGKLTAQSAYLRGKLKVKGSMQLALKVQTVLAASKKAGPGPAKL